MSVNIPATVWSPQSGSGEMSNSGGAAITTLSALNLITLSGNQLVTLESIFTPTPATVWEEDDSL